MIVSMIQNLIIYSVFELIMISYTSFIKDSSILHIMNEIDNHGLKSNLQKNIYKFNDIIIDTKIVQLFYDFVENSGNLFLSISNLNYLTKLFHFLDNKYFNDLYLFSILYHEQQLDLDISYDELDINHLNTIDKFRIALNKNSLICFQLLIHFLMNQVNLDRNIFSILFIESCKKQNLRFSKYIYNLNFSKRSKLIDQAIEICGETGNIEFIEFLCNSAKNSNFSDVIYYDITNSLSACFIECINNDHFNLYKWIIFNNLNLIYTVDIDIAFEILCEKNRLDLVQILEYQMNEMNKQINNQENCEEINQENEEYRKFYIDPITINNLFIKSDKLSIVEYLYKNYRDHISDENIMHKLKQTNNVSIVTLLFNEIEETEIKRFVIHVCQKNKYQILQWICYNDYLVVITGTLIFHCLKICCKYGHNNMVSFLLKHFRNIITEKKIKESIYITKKYKQEATRLLLINNLNTFI